MVVRSAVVAVQDVEYQIKSLGTLEAQDLVQVTAQVEGAVAEVRFHEGDRVTPQTVLLRIDPQRYKLEAERAEAAVPPGRAPKPSARRPTSPGARSLPTASWSRPRS